MLIFYSRALLISKRLNENYEEIHFTLTIYHIIISKIPENRQKFKFDSIVQKKHKPKYLYPIEKSCTISKRLN